MPHKIIAGSSATTVIAVDVGVTGAQSGAVAIIITAATMITAATDFFKRLFRSFRKIYANTTFNNTYTALIAFALMLCARLSVRNT